MKRIETITTVKFFIFTVIFLTLSGCATMDVQNYKNTKPRLLVEDYFDGNSRAWGVFQDRFGKVRRRFEVDIRGTWDKRTNTLTLVEDFVYDDGEEEQRIWNITKTDAHSYTGHADGVVGKATGKSYGNAFNFKYTFNLPVNGDVWKVTFDDWMYLQDENILFNKATVRRWGITLGNVYIFFDKRNQ